MKIKPEDLIDVLLNEDPKVEKIKKKKVISDEGLQPHQKKKDKKKGN